MTKKDDEYHDYEDYEDNGHGWQGEASALQEGPKRGAEGKEISEGEKRKEAG